MMNFFKKFPKRDHGNIIRRKIKIYELAYIRETRELFLFDLDNYLERYTSACIFFTCSLQILKNNFEEENSDYVKNILHLTISFFYKFFVSIDKKKTFENVVQGFFGSGSYPFYFEGSFLSKKYCELLEDQFENKKHFHLKTELENLISLIDKYSVQNDWNKYLDTETYYYLAEYFREVNCKLPIIELEHEPFFNRYLFDTASELALNNNPIYDWDNLKSIYSQKFKGNILSDGFSCRDDFIRLYIEKFMEEFKIHKFSQENIDKANKRFNDNFANSNSFSTSDANVIARIILNLHWPDCKETKATINNGMEISIKEDDLSNVNKKIGLEEFIDKVLKMDLTLSE